MKPKFNKDVNDYATLRCHNCGSDYLHQRKVYTFFRTEDAEEGIVSKTCMCGVTVSSKQDGNPSPRRHGIEIVFLCEQCDKQMAMIICQHKGQTLIETSTCDDQDKCKCTEEIC